MKYIIDGNEFTTAREAADYITENMDDSVYDDMLDECYDEIEICGCTYAPSIALYRVDEIAYNCGKNDYYDSLSGDIASEIDCMDGGDEEEYYGFTVECVDDEADEEETEEE